MVRLRVRSRALRLLDGLELDGRPLLHLLQKPSGRLARKPLQVVTVLQPTSDGVADRVRSQGERIQEQNHYVPVELAQDDARDDDHDGVLDALDIFAELFDDAAVVDEYVRIEYDVKEQLMCDGKRILSNSSQRGALGKRCCGAPASPRPSRHYTVVRLCCRAVQ